jgi:nucleoside-diphosphate-sugar epimerase
MIGTSHPIINIKHIPIMPSTVLVTGATGLLGREVMEAFRRAGWATIGQGYSRATPPKILKANLENIDEIAKLLDEAKYILPLGWHVSFLARS